MIGTWERRHAGELDEEDAFLTEKLEVWSRAASFSRTPERRWLDRALPAAQMGELTRAEPAVDRQTALRVEHLPREVGWVLVTVGVVGLIVPGMLGTPFLFAGVFVLVPGGPRLLSRWAGRNPPKLVRTVMRQVSRFLDDLERRYPRS